MLEPREQALWDAQLRAEALFASVVERGLIVPGVLESELSHQIYELAAADYGVRRHWHQRIVRSGSNTLLTYYDQAADRRLAVDDMVFFDFGPVFDGWEADLGRSYVLGADPRKHQLVKDIGDAFRLGQQRFESDSTITAGALYDYVVDLAKKLGWVFGAPSAGHMVDSFPHEPDRSQPRRYSIRSGNSISLREPLSDGRPRHWILEIHFVDPERQYGGFLEELLTVRGSR